MGSKVLASRQAISKSKARKASSTTATKFQPNSNQITTNYGSTTATRTQPTRNQSSSILFLFLILFLIFFRYQFHY